MGLSHVLAYNWGRQQGGGGGAGPLVLVLLIFMGVMAVIWVVYGAVSAVWSMIHGIVRPILLVYPPVTVPAVTILLAGAIASLAPYSKETTMAMLDGTDDRLTFDARAVLAMMAINGLVLMGATDILPDPNPSGILSAILGLVFAIGLLVFLLYVILELFHLPYRSVRLVRHTPRGRALATAFLTPLLLVVISAAFGVSPTEGLAIPWISIPSSLEIVIGWVLFNLLYAAGPITVKLVETDIRTTVSGTKSIQPAESPREDGSGSATARIDT